MILWAAIVGILSVLALATFALLKAAERRRTLIARLAPPTGPRAEAPPPEAVRPGGVLGCVPPGRRHQIRRELRRAGLRWRPVDLLLICLLAGLVTAAGTHWFLDAPLWSLAAGALGFYLPFAALRARAARRVRRVEEQLADAIDVMVAALDAGIGIRPSMESVRNEMRPPISEEFAEILFLIDFGVPAPRAFRMWARSLDSPFVNMFAISMAAKWDVGGNYSDMLRNLAERVRESVRLRRRILALTGEARLSALIVFVVPYALGLFLWVVQPGHIELLFTHPTGIRAVKLALLLQLGGILLMRKMLKVET